MSESCPHSSPATGAGDLAVSPRGRRVTQAVALLLAVAVIAALLVRGAAGGALLGTVAVVILGATVRVWPRLDLPMRMARLSVVLVLAAGALVLAVPR